MLETLNYYLKKPDIDTDPADITVLNKNMDTIDTALKGLEDGKVAKAAGKQLSTNDFTNAEKIKLQSIAAAAQENVIEKVRVNGVLMPPDANKAVNVNIPDATPVVNSLTSTSATSALSAAQGKILQDTKAAKAELDGHTGNVDIHTSAGEKARLEQELGGKVTARTQAVSSWEQLIKSPSGYYTIMPNVVGMPIVNSFWNCQIISDDRDISGYYSRTFIAFMVGTHELKYQIPWIKNIVNGDDYGWFQLAGALPSQFISVPFINGVTGDLLVRKNQFGEILVILNASSEFVFNQIIAILPEGFRPLVPQGVAYINIAMIEKNTLAVKSMVLAVRFNGDMVCFNGSEGATNILGNFSF